MNAQNRHIPSTQLYPHVRPRSGGGTHAQAHPRQRSNDARDNVRMRKRLDLAREIKQHVAVLCERARFVHSNVHKKRHKTQVNHGHRHAPST